MKHDRSPSRARKSGARHPAPSSRISTRRPTRAAIQIRFLAEELEELDAKAEAAGLDRSKFIRKAVRQSMIIDSDNARRQSWLLANVSNNLNQIAKYANTYLEDADALAIVQQLRGIRAEVSRRFPLPSSNAPEDKI